MNFVENGEILLYFAYELTKKGLFLIRQNIHLVIFLPNNKLRVFLFLCFYQKNCIKMLLFAINLEKIDYGWDRGRNGSFKINF